MIKKKDLIQRLNKNIKLSNKLYKPLYIAREKSEKIHIKHKIIIENFKKIEENLFKNSEDVWTKIKKECQSLGVKIRNDKIRLKNFEGKHTEGEWENLKKEHNNKCACCEKEAKLTKDHIVPIYWGGGNTIKNIQPLCRPCNTKKGTTEIKY